MQLVYYKRYPTTITSSFTCGPRCSFAARRRHAYLIDLDIQGQFLRTDYVIADVSDFSLTPVYRGISFYGKCIVLLVATRPNRL